MAIWTFCNFICTNTNQRIVSLVYSLIGWTPTFVHKRFKNHCLRYAYKTITNVKTIDFWSLIINLIKNTALEKYENAIKEKFLLAYVVRDEVGLAGFLKLDESYFVAEMGDILIKRGRIDRHSTYTL